MSPGGLPNLSALISGSYGFSKTSTLNCLLPQNYFIVRFLVLYSSLSGTIKRSIVRFLVLWKKISN